MGDSTSRLNLYLPGGGSTGLIPDEVADIDKLNQNFRILDDAIGFKLVTSGTRPANPFLGQPIKETDTGDIRYWNGTDWPQLSGVPVGTVSLWPTATPPPGSLKCDGSSVLRAAYPALFNLIGTSYGKGTDLVTNTTFALPDFSGRTAVGPGKVANKQTVPSSGVSTVTSSLTMPGVTNLEYYNGQGVQVSSTGVLPGGLSAGTVYYLGVQSPGVVRFYANRGNVRLGQHIPLTSSGSGDLTVEMLDDFTASLARPYGASSYQLRPSEIPQHTHPGRWINQNVNDGAGNRWAVASGVGPTFGSDGFIGPTGDDATHGNLPPSLGMNYIIRALA